MIGQNLLPQAAGRRQREQRGGPTVYKGVTKKVLLLAWACIFSLAACLFLAFMWDRIFWAGVALSLGLYAAVGAKRLRCPHCGRGETLENLTKALHQECHCRHCGQRIVIR